MIVRIKQGLLEGREDKSMTTGKVFYSFLSIPYAEPPVGELRFRPPVSAAGWEGVRNAKREGDHCFQLAKDHEENESEDCLYLNVFTPEPPNPEGTLKPVIVYFHGGGHYFCDGTMENASPDNLINYDVIIVTLNFRLHIFGFLNLNTPSCEGNCGSKDQVMALRWIQENIKTFGGNPENVTIYGDSTGAHDVHLCTMSPLAKGLFHKAIAGSGTIISPWIRENQVEQGFEIGRRLGFAGSDAEELVTFLKTQSALKLATEAKRIIYEGKKNSPFAVDATMIFVPSIEKHGEDNAFLPDYPVNLMLKSEPVPLLVGVAEKEGVTILFGLDNYAGVLNRLRRNLVDLISANVPCHPSKLAEVTKKVEEYYLDALDDDATETETCDKIVEIYSHLYFMYLYDIIERTCGSSAPAYVYMFSFVGQLNESLTWNMPVTGALHADSSEYTMMSRCLHPNGVQLEDEVREVMVSVCTAYTNFARTSDPNPLPGNNAVVQWQRYTADNPAYMVFDKKCVPAKGKIWEDGLEFWKRIFRTYVCSNEGKSQKWQL